MLIVVQAVERRFCSSSKMCDLYFQPSKICDQSKNYITLKLMQSTIQIFNQPHSIPLVFNCTTAMGSVKYLQYACAHIHPPLHDTYISLYVTGFVKKVLYMQLQII